jgi:hypothetical protein
MKKTPIKDLRVTVFERASKLIRIGRSYGCCNAIRQFAGYDSPEQEFFAKHYEVAGEAYWFHKYEHGPKRQKARERALLRCARLIRKARERANEARR